MSQNHHRYRAIIFDFGGVLIEWDPRRLYSKFFDGDVCAAEHFLSEIGFAEWNQQQDKGRPFAVAVAELCKRFPQYTSLIQAYDERWEESIGGPIQPAVDILRSLKQAGHPLYGLSNWSEEKFQIVRPKYAFFDWFEMIMVSGEVRLAKPDPRIYTIFLNRIGQKAGECLYIDDSDANISIAIQLGFNIIHYCSPGQLKMDLVDRGLLH
jgi:2-haloacid dehalogenase